MSCQYCGNQPLTPLEINVGSDQSFTVKLDDLITGDPYDLTNATIIQATFPNEDGTNLTIDLTSGISIQTPATIGKLTVTLLNAQTTLLKTGVVSFEISMTVSGKKTVVQFPNKLNAISSLFSP